MPYTYDVNGRLTMIGSVPYTYDANGRLTMIGKEKTGRVTKYIYDINGVLQSGNITEYNSDGYPTYFYYDDYTIVNGKTASIAHYTSTPLYPNKALQNTSYYTYDTNGNLSKIDTYDSKGIYSNIDLYTYGTHLSAYRNTNSFPNKTSSNTDFELLSHTSAYLNQAGVPNNPQFNSAEYYFYTYHNDYPVMVSVSSYNNYSGTHRSSNTTYQYEYYNMN